MRIPAAVGEYRRAELRSPDPTANPYLCFALMIYAGLAGIEQDLELPFAVDYNLFKPEAGQVEGLQLLPQSLDEARAVAADSAFIRQCIPAEVLEIYCGR